MKRKLADDREVDETSDRLEKSAAELTHVIGVTVARLRRENPDFGTIHASRALQIMAKSYRRAGLNLGDRFAMLGPEETDFVKWWEERMAEREEKRQMGRELARAFMGGEGGEPS